MAISGDIVCVAAEVVVAVLPSAHRGRFIVTIFMNCFPTAPLESLGSTFIVFVPVVVNLVPMVKELNVPNCVQVTPLSKLHLS